jgi:pilus assembly protein TadC
VNFTERLQRELVLADMDITPKAFLRLCTVPSGIFALCLSLLTFFILKGSGYQWTAILVFAVCFGVFMLLCSMIPKSNAARIERAIEADIFVPSRMLVTLLESGNSLVSSFDRVSKTRTVSGRYFGKIAAEIYLGKNLDQAIIDAMEYTPSRSFRRVLEPIRNSMRTGAAIEQNLLSTLEDLTAEKVVEIERYEKRLGPISMFYMIFGTIVPTIGVVALIILVSVAGISVTFFPLLAILLVGIVVMQIIFLKLFQSVRPLVKL